MPPMVPKVVQMPTAAPLVDVEKSSAVYTYTVVKAQTTPTLPKIENITCKYEGSAFLRLEKREGYEHGSNCQLVQIVISFRNESCGNAGHATEDQACAESRPPAEVIDEQDP